MLTAAGVLVLEFVLSDLSAMLVRLPLGTVTVATAFDADSSALACDASAPCARDAMRHDEEMTQDENRAKNMHPVLLCFDGSNDAAIAIAKAGELLGPRTAVVLTVWEPVALWEPYDPATILTAPASKLASKELGLDEIASQVARETSDRGVALARTAGFEVRGSVAKGKSWRAICDEAEKLDAEPIVVGARGLSRVQSALLGSVSSAVVAHAHPPALVLPGRWPLSPAQSALSPNAQR